MTSLFPHPPYAEDQPYAHSILYLHVTRAAAMTGAGISLFTAPISLVASQRRHKQRLLSWPNLIYRQLIHSGRGFVLGGAAGLLMTWGRMRGMTEVEWQDRTWRLLENKGEMNTDWWFLDGAAVGAVLGATVVRRGRMPLSFGKAVLGGAGVGSTVGLNYMMASFMLGRKPA